MRIEASQKGVEALRDFAEAMPYAVNQIEEETNKFLTRFHSLEPDLGARRDDFDDIVKVCVYAVRSASDALSDLPEGLKASADRLEEWINSRPSVEDNWSGDDSSSTRRGEYIKDTKTVTRR